MNELTLVINVLLGFIVPLLVGLGVRKSWPTEVKGLIMIGLSALAGLLVVAWQGQLDLVNWRNSFIAVVAAAQISYTAVTKNWAQALQEIGNKDSAPAPVLPVDTKIEDNRG